VKTATQFLIIHAAETTEMRCMVNYTAQVVK